MPAKKAAPATAALPPLVSLLPLFFCFASLARAQPPQQQQPQQQPQQQQPTEYRRALPAFEAVDVTCPLTVAVTTSGSDFSLFVTATSQEVSQGINATLDNRTMEIDCSNATFASADPIKIQVALPASATLRSVASRGGGAVVLTAAASSSSSSSSATATAPPSSSAQPNVQPLIQALEQRNSSSNASGGTTTATSNQEPPPPSLVLIASGLSSTLHVRALPANVTTVAIAADSGGAVIVQPAAADSSSSLQSQLQEADVVADDGSAVVVSGVSGLVRVQLGGMARVFVRPSSSQNASNSGSGSQQQPLQVTGSCAMMARVFLVEPDDSGHGQQQQDDNNGDEFSPYASCDASSAPLVVKVWPWFHGSFLGGAHSCCAPVSLNEVPQFPDPLWSCGVDLSSTGGGNDKGDDNGCARQQFFKRSSNGQEAGFVSVRVVSPPTPQSGGRQRGRGGGGGGCTIVSSGGAPTCSVPDDQLVV